MKLHWKNKFTLLFIPDANRQVRTATLPSILLYAVPAALSVVMIGIALWLYAAKMNDLRMIDTLTLRLSDEKESARISAEQKDQTIESLQLKLLQLTEQAEDVGKQLDELKKLEDEIRKLSNIVEPEAVTIASIDEIRLRQSTASGGSTFPVSGNDMDALASYTQLSYRQLKHSILDLSVSMSEMVGLLEEREHIRNITPSLWPTGSRRITSLFGVRKDPFTGRPAFHSGIDIAGKTRDPVFATADGIVEWTGRDATHGNHIIINHSRGIRTVYMHLHKIFVKQGERVKKGDSIGQLGSTGRSTGPHLHYEVKQSGRFVNPAVYLP